LFANNEMLLCAGISLSILYILIQIPFDKLHLQNSEDDVPVKGTITLSDGVKLQESGNFYRLTQVKEQDEEKPVYIVHGNQPSQAMKGSMSFLLTFNIFFYFMSCLVNLVQSQITNLIYTTLSPEIFWYRK